MKKIPAILLASALLAALSAAAQTSPVVPEKIWTAVANEVSGDISYNHLRTLTLFHAPNGSNDDFEKEAEWVAQKAREFGLTDVKIMWLGGGGRPWNVRSGEAWIVGPEEMKLGDVQEHPLRVGVGSHSADVEAELVDVGDGTRESDYEGKDVAGKIVLASGNLGAVQRLAVFTHGAAGIINYSVRRTGFPDQMPFLRISEEREGKSGGFAWVLTPREGELLAQKVRAWQRGGQAVRARVKLETISMEERQGIVEGWIRGTGALEGEQVVLTSHLQEERTSANDDRSGVANMLEIARTLNKLIQEGKLERPKRDIRFWWLDEIGAQYRYFGEHPEEAGRMLAALNQDMVGAKQSEGFRVQYLSRTPFSRPSFVSDVMESILNAVVAGNTAWPLRQGSDNGDFSRPMMSALGTREPYRAVAVPFYDSTDHMPFNDGRVGVPATSLTNWPDPYIHSSDDDLWNVDATQLRRNAFVNGLGAYLIASMEESDVPGLVALLLGGAEQRLGAESRIALGLLADEAGGTPEERYLDARTLMEVALERELGSLNSARVFATPGGRGAGLINSARGHLTGLAESMLNYLDAFFQTMGHRPTDRLPSEMATAARTVPAWKTTLLQALTGEVNVPGGINGLHGHYVFEVRNLIDGQRSVYDIYRIVRAAALSSGNWYYGPVEFSTVKQYLDNLKDAGAVEFRQM